LEERQLLAEHDLLETQAQETQNVATALKYIEAYCLGAKSQQEHTHTVSVDDFKKLERQKLLQQGLPRKHASAINVLRARQELDFKRRLEIHEAELKQLDADLEKEESAKEEEYKKESEQLEKVIEARRKRLIQRWELKFEMCGAIGSNSTIPPSMRNSNMKTGHLA
jgi:predicted RNA-binding protein with PIN domain